MSSVRLRSELIYEAMVDDEAFALLPSALAEATGARSCVIHWRDARDAAEIMAHSAYFSPEQMLNYATNFVEHDQWSNVGRERPSVNRANNTKSVVDPASYERSVFYNEWIRAMGDDTFHCIGSVMETGRGLGLIGLHRGKGQSDFSAAAMRELERHLVDLRRMLTVRARMATDAACLRGLGALLDGQPAPMLALSVRAKIIHANRAAQLLLQTGHAVRDIGGHLHVVSAAGARRMNEAIARATAVGSAEAGVVVLDGPRGPCLEFTVAPVRDGGAPLVLLSGRALDTECGALGPPAGTGEALAPREMMVAQLVARGLRNREIAAQLGLTEGTVKAYLHTVFDKLGVGTRTELALRIGPH